RPLKLKEWIGAGRGSCKGSRGAEPRIASVTVYGAAWWRWWSGLLPEWRQVEPTAPLGTIGRFTQEEFPAQELTNWRWLCFPGPNGVLSLVAMLYWWGGE
ncbi:hypothetical protein C8J57DRAFT_954217, partial [Mycena rebaudengoi]